MKSISKALVGTIAVGAMAMTSVSPAMARDGHGNDIGTGEIIAGALIIGGIAAVAAAASDKDRGRYGYDDNYGRKINSRRAVKKCVRAAERDASRYGRGSADVTDIRRVDRKRSGYTIKGRIAVNKRGNVWRTGDRTYGRGWDSDYRGSNYRNRGYDSGKFTCDIRHGQVVDVRFKNIRGL